MHHSPKAAKQCRLSEDYGHRDTLAANWGDPNDPERTPVGRLHCCVISFVIQSFGQFTLRARGSRSEISAWKHAPRDGATKTPISLLLEGETAGTALDAFSSAARALELSQRVIVARGSPWSAQGDNAGADDDFAEERRVPVGPDFPIKNHRTGLAFDTFQAMIRAVLHLTRKPITVARKLTQVRAGPRGLPRSVEFLRRRRRIDDQVNCASCTWTPAENCFRYSPKDSRVAAAVAFCHAVSSGLGWDAGDGSGGGAGVAVCGGGGGAGV